MEKTHCNKGHLLSDKGRTNAGECRACKLDIDRKWRKANPEKCAQYTKKYRQKNPGITRDFYIRKNYGISLEEQNSYLEKQGGCCALCGIFLDSKTKNTKPHIDHDHTTKKVRGILCHACNTALGLFKDNTAVLLKVAQYLLSV